MKPIIILPNDEEEITLKAEELTKHLNDAYDNGYEYGYEKGKNERIEPSIVYRKDETTTPLPYVITPYYDHITCNNNGDINNDVFRSK